VSQPASNRVDVDSGAKQVSGHGMADHMSRDAALLMSIELTLAALDALRLTSPLTPNRA
jgi:hypothetical protein